MRKIYISIIFIASCLISRAQVKTAVQEFYRHIQSCHLIGTTESDYTIEIFDDSSIRVVEYISDYLDQYNSILKAIYSGTYVKKVDTIRIHYLSKSTEIKHKKPVALFSKAKLPTTAPGITPISGFYPSAVLIITGVSITSTDNMLPSLEECLPSQIALLSMKFDTWETLKYNNEKSKLTQIE